MTEHTCEHFVDFAHTMRCIALALPGRSKCTVHDPGHTHTSKCVPSWPAGQPFPVYWQDAEPRLAFDTPWEA